MLIFVFYWLLSHLHMLEIQYYICSIKTRQLHRLPTPLCPSRDLGCIKDTRTHTAMHVCTRTQTHTHTHAHRHARTHTDTPTHTRTSRFSRVEFLSSLLWYSGVAHHSAITCCMVVTFSLALCTLCSRSLTSFRVASMYSHAPSLVQLSCDTAFSRWSSSSLSWPSTRGYSTSRRVSRTVLYSWTITSRFWRYLRYVSSFSNTAAALSGIGCLGSWYCLRYLTSRRSATN